MCIRDRYDFTPDETPFASVRPGGPVTGTTARRGGVVVGCLGARCRRHTDMIVVNRFTPDETLLAGVRSERVDG